MRWRNSARRYGATARVLHWSSVALVAFLFVDISGIDEAPKLAAREAYVYAHAAGGTALLALMLVRLWWRRANANPVFAYQIGPGHRRLALTVHRGLYLLVLAQCVLGIASVWLDGRPLPLFALVDLPPVAALPAAPVDALKAVHASLGNVILGLVVLHASAAIINQVFVPPEEGAGDGT